MTLKCFKMRLKQFRKNSLTWYSCSLLPWVPEVFSCVRWGAPFCRPKTLGETENRAWKVSGTQGSSLWWYFEDRRKFQHFVYRPNQQAVKHATAGSARPALAPEPEVRSQIRKIDKKKISYGTQGTEPTCDLLARRSAGRRPFQLHDDNWQLACVAAGPRTHLNLHNLYWAQKKNTRVFNVRSTCSSFSTFSLKEHEDR